MDTCKTGTVTCSNPAVAITITMGFRPAAVFIFNVDDTGTEWWSRTLTDAHGHRSVGSTGVETAITSHGITPLDNGFIIGLDTEINGADNVLHWIAWRGEAV